MVNYNPWPIGQVPHHLRRQEPELIRELGYNWNDPRDIVGMFEDEVAKFSGAKYCVATDCCTHALELSFRYLLHRGELHEGDTIALPYHTYISAAILPLQLGLKLQFRDIQWSGRYFYGGTRIVDGAVRWLEYQYLPNTLYCISFQIKKKIPIGRGGCVLTNDLREYEWLKLASYDGRDLTTPYTDPNHVKFPGYHYYMTPECAARGLYLMHHIKEQGDTANYTNYPNVKTMLNL